MQRVARLTETDRLIQEVRSGSDGAFSDLVRLYQAKIRTYLYRFLSNRESETVDDLAQETFLTAYRNLSAYAGETPFELWLIRIAKNRALTYLRNEQRRRAREDAALESALSGWLAGRMDSKEGELSQHEQRLKALQACLERLPERSAHLIRDHYLRGRSGVELSRETGKKEGTIWVTLLRIRQALRECIQVRLKTSGAGP